MLKGMSIRMKEWGMMNPPSRGIHMPTDGLTGWGAAAQRMGEGISAVLAGGARVLQERARVTTAGELADFTERLKVIGQETRDELAEQDVQDWNYAWQKTAAPKLAEAVGELSLDARGAGRQLAEVYSARESLEAQRDHELQRIDKARAQWRSRVDEAVQAGDARKATEWLQAGQGVFVAPGDMEAEQQRAHSRASLNYWQNELNVRPLVTLQRLAGADEHELPADRQDAERLRGARTRAGRAARAEVVQSLLSCMEDGVTPEPAYLKQAEEAGVLTPKQSAEAQQPPAGLTAAGRREWLRRVDECANDEQETEKLQLEIATAPIPVAERRQLLNRLEQSMRIPVGDRLSMSRRLWELYHSGVLGCPNDVEAQQHFAALQQQALDHLEQQGLPAVTDSLQHMQDLADRWVCFDPQSQTQQK